MLESIEPERVYLTTDCGLKALPRFVAPEKLKALCARRTACARGAAGPDGGGPSWPQGGLAVIKSMRRYNRRLSETEPVWFNPIARAAAGVKSICLPRTKGPRSLIRTVTHPW